MNDVKLIKQLSYRHLKSDKPEYDESIIAEINRRAESIVETLRASGRLEEYGRHVSGYAHYEFIQGLLGSSEYLREFDFKLSYKEFPEGYYDYIADTKITVIWAAIRGIEYYKSDRRPYIFTMKCMKDNIEDVVSEYISCYYIYSFTLNSSKYYNVVTYDTEHYNLYMCKQEAERIKEVKVPQDRDLQKAIRLVAGHYDVNTYKPESYTEPGFDNRKLDYSRDFVCFRDPLEESKKVWLSNRKTFEKMIKQGEARGNAASSIFSAKAALEQLSYKSFYEYACKKYA